MLIGLLPFPARARASGDGEAGISTLVRIMGLLLVALAMLFFVNALTNLGVIPTQR